MTKNVRLGVVMDPISGINPVKDSTLAMLLEAQQRGHDLVYFEQSSLRLRDGVALGSGRSLRVFDSEERWFELGEPAAVVLGGLDVILMRKDPPFDTEYIYTSYLLERAELAGAVVVNKPTSLREINEKAFTAWFPQCCPPTLITRSIDDMREFLSEHGHIVVKPLDGMGGHSIFVVHKGDLNANVIFETLTADNERHAMAQLYIPEIRQGDKRVLLVDGAAPELALARVPPEDDNRGNLVAGAQPEVRPLTERDRWIVGQVGPALRQRGVLFAGLDVIGNYLTEVNVTSPTGIREIRKLSGLDLAATLVTAIEARLQNRARRD